MVELHRLGVQVIPNMRLFGADKDTVYMQHIMTGDRLTLDPNIAVPDEFYEQLIRAHDGLSDEESRLLNAKLVLILANQIGDLELLRDAIALACSATRTP